jgi:hypothetical protein
MYTSDVASHTEPTARRTSSATRTSETSTTDCGQWDSN